MTPYKFTVKNGITHFHYKYKQLREFVKAGQEDGNVGWILTTREGLLVTYRGYGTIESPAHNIQSISLNHFEPFDGKMPTDEERLIPPKPMFTKENTKIVFLDLSTLKLNNYEDR